MTRATLLHELGATAGALAALERTGALATLIAGPVTAAALARAHDLDARATGLVLEMLHTADLLDRTGDRYAAGPELRRALDSPPGAHGHVAFWGGVEHLLRTGSPPRHDDLASRDRDYPAAVDYLARLFAGAARKLAGKLAGLLAAHPAPRILDVGAGSGIWSLTVAERAPAARVTALDLPSPCERFLHHAGARGLRDRVDAIVGDYLEVALEPGRFQLVIAANVLHLEAADRARALLARLAPAVADGGALVVVDMLDGDTAERRRVRAAYALHLALRIESGTPHLARELGAWLTDAGLGAVRRLELPSVPGLGALIATRSAR